LNQIPQEKKPNDPVILGFYKDAMSANVNYTIRCSQTNDLEGAIQKEMKMEEFMLETNLDPEIILGKVNRQMDTLGITHQVPSTSRNVETEELVEESFKGFPLMSEMT